MNEDMPWVNLTQEEVEELRNKKHELTEYGKQRLKELMRNQEPYPDEMFDEPLLNSLQGTMATIDPYSVKKEAIDEYRMDTIEERLTLIEDKVDLLITQLKIEFYKKND